MREGAEVFASKARSSPTPLRSVFGGLRGAGLTLLWGAPTGRCIPARGGTPGRAKPQSMRSEGTLHNVAPRHQASAR